MLHKLHLNGYRTKPWSSDALRTVDYRFGRNDGRKEVAIGQRDNERKFCLIAYQNGFDRQVIIGQQNPFTSLGKIRWSIKPPALLEIAIDPTLRKSGISQVLMNILLRGFYEEDVSFREARVTRIFGFNDSSLAILFFLMKFGFSCFHDDDLSILLKSLTGMSLSVRNTLAPATGYHLYGNDPFSNNWNRFFLPGHEGDAQLHERLAHDKAKLTEMIRAQQAVMALQLRIDPDIADSMQEHARSLPPNQLY